jgi:hypothetical protein
MVVALVWTVGSIFCSLVRVWNAKIVAVFNVQWWRERFLFIGVVYIVVTSPPATEKIEAVSCEIESRRALHRVSGF